MSPELLGKSILAGVFIVSAIFFFLAGVLYKSETGGKWMIFASLGFLGLSAFSTFTVSIFGRYLSLEVAEFIVLSKKIILTVAALLFATYFLKRKGSS